MKLSSLLMFGSMAVLGAAFTSCSKDIAFDSEGVEKAAAEKLNAEYRTNFEKKYGAINPSQTWDFASMKPISGLPSASQAATRGVGDETPATITVSKESTGTMTIEKEAIAWMRNNMKAGVNNFKKGSPFYLLTQEQTFTIVPFYQGQASYYWELWMKVGGQEHFVWSKNTDLTYMTDDGKSHNLTNSGVPAEAVEVSAPTYTYKATSDVSLYFILKVWTGGKKTSATPDVITSLDKMMLALENVTKPANVPEGNQVTIIGCEDNQKTNSDNDYEDLIFMIYGKPTPPIIPVDETEITETKRYMMEDLGTTDDFDFNDVVVDVQNVWTQKIHLKYTENNGWEEDYRDDPVYKGQRAIVRAAGGIYDFKLKIGDKEWCKREELPVGEMLNTGWGGSTIYTTGIASELARFDVTGWDKDNNNISLTVYRPDAHDSNGMTIKFPNPGDAPMIIAVDEDEDWMTERVSAPKNWFTTE